MTKHDNSVFVSSVIAYVMCPVLLLFGSWTWFLLLNDLTTIEFMQSRRDEKKNGWRYNLYTTFGSSSILKCLLPSVRTMPFTGYHYKIYE